MSKKDNEITKERLIEVIEIISNVFKDENSKYDLYKDEIKEESFAIIFKLFRGYFNFIEGSPFSSDKARYVTRTLIKSFEIKENIIFDSMSYNKPNTIKDTDSAFEVYLKLTNISLKTIKELIDLKNETFQEWKKKQDLKE